MFPQVHNTMLGQKSNLGQFKTLSSPLLLPFNHLSNYPYKFYTNIYPEL